ncbi:MAG: restriction endonuclease subunit S [Spirosomaceae bacterium]|jgi:type I restriction enzyme S subunit|nr:restriction endonuclease subunit S [Spirosomataceae bacterium]MCU0469599.1 restriction endonuclease subunit S [Arcicella sp.]
MEDWVSSQLKEIILIKRGYAFKSKDYRETGDFILRVTNMENKTISMDNAIFLDISIAYLFDSFRVDEGDILLVMVGASTGKISIVPKVAKNVLLNQNIWNLKPDSSILNKKFFFYNATNIVRNHLSRSQGSARDFLKQKDFEQEICFYPKSLKEQAKIAEILTEIDEAISKTEALIEKYKSIKTGLMQDLLSKGIDADGKIRSFENHPFKDSPIGKIPLEWDCKYIGEIAEHIRSGVTPKGGSKVYQKEGVLLIRSQNVHNSKLLLDDVAYINEKINEQMLGSQLEKYDVLLNITGASIGRSAFVPSNLPKANVNQHVCAIRQNTKSESRALFLSEFLISEKGQNQIKQNNAGGNREGINYSMIKAIRLGYPQENSEFDRIAKCIKTFEKTLILNEIELSKLQTTKTGLMQDLLSGKVRVTNLLNNE